MDKAIQIAIQQLAGTHDADNVYLFDAVVRSVDKENRICTVTKVGGKTSGVITVRLMASKDDGCYVIPVLDSNVIVIGSNNVTPFIAQFSEVESIEWLGGENDGVPLVNPLLEKINNLENDINNLKTAFSTWVVAPSDGGAALKTTATTWASQQLQPTTKQDIEHTKIKH